MEKHCDNCKCDGGVNLTNRATKFFVNLGEFIGNLFKRLFKRI